MQNRESIGSLNKNQRWSIIHRGRENGATVFIHALTIDAKCVIRSGKNQRDLTTSFNAFGGGDAGWRGRVERVDYPVGASIFDRVTVIEVTQGLVAVEAYSPDSDLQSFLIN